MADCPSGLSSQEQDVFKKATSSQQRTLSDYLSRGYKIYSCDRGLLAGYGGDITVVMGFRYIAIQPSGFTYDK